MIYRIWNSREYGFWHKAREIVLEVLIIILAVSISSWFHNHSKQAHEQSGVKAFLPGLQRDLKMGLYQFAFTSNVIKAIIDHEKNKYDKALNTIHWTQT